MDTRAWLAGLSTEVQKLPDIMQDCHVEEDIIERLARWINEVAAALKSAKPRTSA
jgi:hypothetical protein